MAHFGAVYVTRLAYLVNPTDPSSLVTNQPLLISMKNENLSVISSSKTLRIQLKILERYRSSRFSFKISEYERPVASEDDQVIQHHLFVFERMREIISFLCMFIYVYIKETDIPGFHTE